MSLSSASNKSQAGFSLIELLVALGVFTVMATSIVMLSGLALDDAGKVLMRLRAKNYAREGVEAARSIKNEDWTKLTEGEHGIEIENGKWTFAGNYDQPDTNFKRWVKVERTASDKKRVTAKVAVSSDSYSQTFEFRTSLTNWEKEADTPGGAVDLGEQARDVYVKGNYAYLAVCEQDKSLAVVDVSDPANPSLSSTYDLKGKGRAVFVKGDYLYLALDTNKVKIMDISAPSSPQEVATINVSAQPSSLWVEDDYLYIGQLKKNEGLVLYSVADPTTPWYQWSYSVGSEVYDVEVQDPWIWMAVNLGRGLDIASNEDYAHVAVDIEDGGFQEYIIQSVFFYWKIGDLDINGRGADVDSDGDTAYLAVKNPDQGLARVDVSDKYDPQFLSGEDIGAAGNGIFVTENYIYLATQNENQGLIIVPRN